MLGKLLAHIRRQWMGALALFLVLSGGIAYAGATIGSEDVINDSLKSVDLKDNQVKSADVRDASLIKGDLGVSAFFNRDFGEIPAESCTGLTGTVTGATVNDLVIVHPGTSTIASDYSGGGGLVVTGLPGTNEITMKVCNVTGNPINPPAQNFAFLVVSND